MKKILVILILTIAAMSAHVAFAAESADIDKLISERKSDCWVEGEKLGDIIIGARGVMQLIYLDSKLSRAIAEDRGLANWIEEFNQYYGRKGTEKKAIFIVELRANKPWTFELEKITVGQYCLNKDDILSPSWKNPFGTIDSGTVWHFAFVVPASELKKGKEIPVGYGEYMTKWSVPK